MSTRKRAAPWMVALFSLAAMLSVETGALAQPDPCAEEGPGCRVMTAAEVTALKARFLALREALPVPDPARYALDKDVGDAYTMPFVAEANIPGVVLTCHSWPAGAFTPKNDMTLPYLKNDAAQEIEHRIEVLARLFPHAYLVYGENGKCIDVSDPDAVNVEKSATFLSWESADGTILRMVFGPRTCKESETWRAEKPAGALAPLQSIELEIVGPAAEVAALKKKIDRKAVEALLGAVMK
jgi:hypothetical protein